MKRMPSVMQKDFAVAPAVRMPRSTFNRTHGVKTTFNFDQLPFFVDLQYPGDTAQVNMEGFARMSKPIWAPMDNLFMETFFFFVPLRLVHDNFAKMMGEQENPGDSIDFVTPKITSPAGGWDVESLQDQIGIRPGIANLTTHNYVGRAYNLIYNEWFRDQNLQDSIPFDKGDGPDSPTDYVIRDRNKKHDYFTSCLPWPQKGNAVQMPVGGLAPVEGIGFRGTPANLSTQFSFREADGQDSDYQRRALISGETGTADTVVIKMDSQDASTAHPAIFANLDRAENSEVTLNTLRLAIHTQEILELEARTGSRLTEIIRGHFGVQVPDYRLQRPEFLGGGSTRIHVHPVASTSDYAESNTGDIRSFATASLSGHGFSKSFDEHGYVIGLINVRADLTYQQGTHRDFFLNDKLDFYFPAYAGLGEQPVYNREIFTQGADASGDPDVDVFGYQESYAHMRFKPSEIRGRFRSDAPSSLDSWHASQDFDLLPELGDAFITSNTPRRFLTINGLPNENLVPDFIYDGYIRFNHARVLPVHGIPSSLRRF